MNEGYAPLAHVIREARLAFYDPDDYRRAIGVVQIQLNFSLLYLASLFLLRITEEQGWENLLFSSRDCHLWYLLFRSLVSKVAGKTQSQYFYTSRVARSYPSTSYLEYLAEMCGGLRSAIIDITGTGWSLTRLLDTDVGLFVIHKFEDEHLVKYYQSLANVTALRPIRSVVQGSDNSTLEAYNTAAHPMVVDVRRIGSAFFPVFAPFQWSRGIQDLIAFSQTTFQSVIQTAEGIGASDVSRMVALVRPAHIAKLVVALSRFGNQIDAVRQTQLAENRQTADLIAMRKNRGGVADEVDRVPQNLRNKI